MSTDAPKAPASLPRNLAGAFDLDEAHDELRGRGRRRVLVIAVGGPAALIAAGLAAMMAGQDGNSLQQFFQVLHLEIFGGVADTSKMTLIDVIWGIKMPRILLSFLAGGLLALAGTVMQGLLRNPLVSEHTLGLSPAAAFGASLVIVISSMNGTGYSGSVAFAALVFGLATSAVVLGVASAKGLNVTVLILLGIAVTWLFTALTATVQYFANPAALGEIARWTFGSVNDADWGEVQILAIVFVVSFPIIMWKANALNAIAFAGDDMARSLGVHVKFTRLLLIFVAVGASSFVVSYVGIIGFVGLVAPHISRFLVGSDHRFLVPFAAVMGAVLLSVSDTIGRTVLEPVVIPVGIVISLVGAPMFVYLILRRRASL